MLLLDVEGALRHLRLTCRTVDLQTYANDKRENELFRWRVRSVLSFSRRTFLNRSPSSNDSPLAKRIAFLFPGRLPQAAYRLLCKNCPRWVGPESTRRCTASSTWQIALLWRQDSSSKIVLGQKSWQTLGFSFNGFHVARSSLYAVAEVWCACSGAMTLGVHLTCSNVTTTRPGNFSCSVELARTVWDSEVELLTSLITPNEQTWPFYQLQGFVFFRILDLFFLLAFLSAEKEA